MFLKRLDKAIPVERSAGRACPSSGAGPNRTLYITSWLRYSSTQQDYLQTQSHNAHSPFVEEQASSQPFEQGVRSVKENLELSGIGPVGQQAKDLQERVSSISAASEGTPKLLNAPPKKSRSTPARLARRERRMPSRRFQGDRTRPEPKQTVSSRDVSQEKEKKPRRVNDPYFKTAGDVRDNILQRAEIRGKSLEKHFRSTKTASEMKESGSEYERAKSRIGPWAIQKRALKEKFGEQGWMPRKRLSPDALEGIRTLHAQYPETYSTPVLAERFKVSPEAIRRILKSKWRPSEPEEEERKRRWEKRGENIWTEMNEKGIKPPKKWREKGISRPAEREGKGRRYLTLEEEIGTESDRGVITTRTFSGQEKHQSLATRII